MCIRDSLHSWRLVMPETLPAPLEHLRGCLLYTSYVDHPSFGTAIISRLLEAHGYKVGIIAQPDWKDKKSIEVLGRPRLGFLVSAGNMDSMVNHYSDVYKRKVPGPGHVHESRAISKYSQLPCR